MKRTVCNRPKRSRFPLPRIIVIGRLMIGAFFALLPAFAFAAGAMACEPVAMGDANCLPTIAVADGHDDGDRDHSSHGSGNPAAPASFDPSKKIAAAVAMVQPVAYRSKSVDWKTLTARMMERTRGARDDIDMLPAWTTLAAGLEDGHSFVQPTSAAKSEWRKRYGDRPIVSDGIPARRLRSRYVDRVGITQTSVSLEQGRSAVAVTVPSVMGLGPDAKSYAATLFRAIADVDPKTCAYILDLRGNTGGNVWPMLLGLSGLLGDGPQGRARDASGKTEPYANVAKGSIVVLAERGRGLTMMELENWRSIPRLTSAPVALIVDDATASSGEGVAVAFAGRRSTRIFGERTYGAASSNEGFQLADGTNLVVTTAMMVDRRGRTYPTGIVPDQPVSADGSKPLNAAKAWLSRQPACTHRARST